MSVREKIAWCLVLLLVMAILKHEMSTHWGYSVSRDLLDWLRP